MVTYLLLRDNKQNGPYTFDEIKAKGLKAYDLVWVEGKSAAWRYPGEVEELKPFSPAVVEQPYDRFFKRPSQENKPAEQIIKPPVAEKEIINPSYQQASLQVGKRNIYVTLPAAKNNVVNKEIFVEKEPIIAETNARDYQRPVVPQNNVQNTILAEEELYTKPQQTIAQQTPNKIINKEIFSQKSFALQDGFKNMLVLSAVVIALISAGIFIGLSINKNSSAQKNNVVAEQQSANNLATAFPVSSIVSNNNQPQNEIVTDNKNINPENSATEKKSEVIVPKKKIIATQDKTVVAQNPIPATTSNDDTNKNITIIQTTHREATHRIDAATDKETLKNTLVNLVSVANNKYNVGTFGGISDLQLSVNNKSVHALDLVVVEVQYLQANKKIFKTENIYFHNINAGETMMLEAPKSARGIKVQSKITVINAKEPGLSYSGS